MNAALSFAYHKWLDRPDRWHPIMGVFYLTYACDFRCPYCSDGYGKPYYSLASNILRAEQALAVIQAMRSHCDYLVITGGEPLQHPEIIEVLRGLPAFSFKSIILTTNGYRVDACLEQIAQPVNQLVFSLDTLHEEKADPWYGRGPGTLRKILHNLDLAAQWPDRPFEIIVSSVVTPDNLADLYEVYEFARERRFRFAACPQLVGVKAHPALADNPAYRAFYNFLLAEKRQGRRIQGTLPYLECLRDLRKFTCHPFTMLVVSPTGDVFYPCLEIGHFAGNLLQESNLHRIRQQGFARFGGQPQCGNQCHSACALGFANLLANPASVLPEAGLRIKGWLNGY